MTSGRKRRETSGLNRLLADQIANDAREKVSHVPGVLDADVRIVWQPAWTPKFMSPEARKKLMIVS